MVRSLLISLTAIATFLSLSLTTLAAQAATATDGGGGKPNNILVDLGFGYGGINLGAGFEHMMNPAQGVGGQLHFYNKDSKRGADGWLILGGFTGYHFYKGSWDFSLAPGLNLIMLDSVSDRRSDATTLGPSVQISLVEQLNDQLSLGFDFANYFVWFAEDYRGAHLADLNVRLKIGF